MTETVSRVPSIGENYLTLGHAMLQNLPSIICGHVLNPQPNERILDMCASPGNKTTHLAELMADKGQIIALDKNKNKLKQLEEKIAKYNFDSVKCYDFDATKAVDENAINSDGPPFAPETFDRILLDAPCSALGNRPQLRNDISPKMLSSYPAVQKNLMKAAVKLLKSAGGTLVYSTCTITAEENEKLVAWTLEKFPMLELVEANPIVGGSGWVGFGLDESKWYSIL